MKNFNLSLAILHIFPSARPMIDFLVVDNGLGPEIAEWNLSAPRPSVEELMKAEEAASLTEAKKQTSFRIDSYAKENRTRIAGTPDDAEIAGWNNKLRIAQAILTDTATDIDKAAFQAEIAARDIEGETLEIFVQKVIRNAEFYAQAVGLIDGLKRKTQDAVSAAKTPEDVEKVLIDMKAQAEAAFEKLMQ